MTPEEARITALEAEVRTVVAVVDGLCVELLKIVGVLETQAPLIRQMAHALLDHGMVPKDDGR